MKKIRKIAIVAGTTIMLMGIVAIFTYGFVYIPFILVALSYLTIHVLKNLFRKTIEVLGLAEILLSIPIAIGKFAFALWFVFKGGKC